jgi:hypothetical protein
MRAAETDGGAAYGDEVSVFKQPGITWRHADIVDPGTVFAHIGYFHPGAGQSNYGMVPGNRRITNNNAFVPVNSPADAAKEYFVGQIALAGYPVLILPLQVGPNRVGFRWHFYQQASWMGYEYLKLCRLSCSDQICAGSKRRHL